MDSENLIKEFIFKAVRSSGPGGQHVNKTSSKVEVSFHIKSSNVFLEDEKELLHKKLSSKISSEGFLKISCSDTRSQHQNKILVIERLLALLNKNLKKEKPRKKTKPSKSSIEKRLHKKKKHATKKATRKPPEID